MQKVFAVFGWSGDSDADPRDDLGGGILGWLDFSRERVQRLIDRGFRDAVAHDCDRSGCVRADGRIAASRSKDIDPNQ